MHIQYRKHFKPNSRAAIVFALVMLPLFVACKSDRNRVLPAEASASIGADGETTAPTDATPRIGGDSTSTNVGSGGIGAKATWDKVASELSDDLRRLIIPPIEKTIFERIKARLPELIRTTRVEFVDYPLILGRETCEGRSDANFSGTGAACSLVNSENNMGAERDAINFPSCGVIKVSRPRFDCYGESSDRIKRLVLHEYLGMMDITETDSNGLTNYATTNALIEAFKGIARFDSGLRVEMIRTCKDFERTTNEHESHQMNGNDIDDRLAYPFIIWRLASHLDCSGETLTRKNHMPSTLRGHLDGDGYTLVPPRLPKNDISPLERRSRLEYERHGQALYEMVCARCVIGNINIVNAEVYGTALLAANNYGTIKNISVQGKLKTWPRTQGDAQSRHTYIGGLVTSNEGFISDVEVDIEINDQEYDHSILGNDFQIYLGGFAALNRGVISNIRSRTKIEVDRVQIGGFINQNFGPIRNVEAVVDIRTSNPGRYIGGFGTSIQNAENIKVSGWIRFPTLVRKFAADINKPENGNLALVGGYTAFAGAEDVKGAIVDVNVCGNVTVEKSQEYPSYSLIREPGVARFVNDTSKPRYTVTGKVFDRCPGGG